MKSFSHFNILSFICSFLYMLYCSWDMMCNRCNCYFSFWVIFCPFTSLTAQKVKILKNEGKTWRFHHSTAVYQKSWSYAIMFQRYGAWRMQLFFILGHFLLFYSPNSPKNQNFEKMKTRTGDIIILHLCTKNYDQMMYDSWDMVRHRIVISHFGLWLFFSLLPSNSPKNQNFEIIKIKKRREIPSF